MNWKFIFQLSMLGFIMAFGTIALIPARVEPFFWLVIFVICAFMIARVCHEKHFAYGFFVSIFNSIWITVAHLIFYNTYAVHHPEIIGLLPLKSHPALSMLLIGIASGVLAGLIQGLLALIASKLVKSNPQD